MDIAIDIFIYLLGHTANIYALMNGGNDHVPYAYILTYILFSIHTYLLHVLCINMYARIHTTCGLAACGQEEKVKKAGELCIFYTH